MNMSISLTMNPIGDMSASAAVNVSLNVSVMMTSCVSSISRNWYV